MSAPADREFRLVRRGEIRELILNYFRDGLRRKVNPETSQYFTEDEIAVATAPGTRWSRQAQADDDYAQSEQRRALFLANQLQIDRACSQYLSDYHGRQWDPEGKLHATSGAGQVLVTGTAGTHIIGSPTIGDSSAYWGRAANGARFQAFSNVDVGSNNSALATVIAMDPGAHTNLAPNEIITWAFKDPNMAPTATVATQLQGGADAETDAEWAARMIADIRHKPGGGNDAQQRSWARRSGSDIEDAFIYPCALGSGTLLICITSKRALVVGPLARIAGEQTIARATSYLVPPGSPVEPSPPRIVVTAANPEISSVGLRLSLAKGSANGFLDAVPFPTYSGSGNLPAVSDVDGSDITITCPNDADSPYTFDDSHQPRLFAWHYEESKFEELSFGTTLRRASANTYTFTLTAPLSWLTVGRAVCPQFARRDMVAKALSDYFDERGPGELFAASSTDIRANRCIRFPETTEEKPCRAGDDIATRVIEVFGGSTVDSDAWVSTTSPAIPTSAVLGPNMLILADAGVYPME